MIVLCTTQIQNIYIKYTRISLNVTKSVSKIVFQQLDVFSQVSNALSLALMAQNNLGRQADGAVCMILGLTLLNNVAASL